MTLRIVAAGTLLSACGGTPAGPPADAEGPVLQTIAAGLSTPLLVTAPPGDDRLFIVEKAGRIRIWDGALRTAPFLDISAKVSTGSEQGLLGLAFHPGYASNGLFIINYTDQGGTTRVASLRVSAADPDRADPATEQVRLSLNQPFSNHNGGHVAFGPDGHLYVGTGDGGSAGDPQGNAQNPGSRLGKLLRFAVDPAGQFTLPGDNPFAGDPAYADGVWALGLRNPWRFSFDRGTGDLYIGDVGQNAREEINRAAAADGGGRGRNFGWNVVEGTRCFAPSTGCSTTGLTPPALEYDHGDGCSVIGGFVYRGAAVPVLAGHYLYADLCGGWVRSARFGAAGPADQREWPDLAPPGGQITSFGQDAAGELYLTTAGGTVYRIVPGGT